MSKLYLNGRLCNGNARSKKTEEEQQQYTLDELKQVARDNGVPNASKLNKEALCQAILDFAKSKSVMIVGPPMVKQPVAAVPVLVRQKTPIVEKPIATPVLVRQKTPVVEKPIAVPAVSSLRGKTAPANNSRGCVEQHDAKYQSRDSPPYPANQCCGQILYGNPKGKNKDKRYISKEDKNGTCKWVLYK